MTKHEKRLLEVCRIAEDASTFLEHRHAAALYIGNELVSVGVNQMKTHPLQAKFGRNTDSIFLHAEIDCIRNALRRVAPEELKRGVLYVAKSKHGQPKLSKPCAGCQRAIIHFGISDVHWTT